MGGAIGSAAGLVSPTVDTDKVSKELDEDIKNLGKSRQEQGLHMA